MNPYTIFWRKETRSTSSKGGEDDLMVNPCYKRCDFSIRIDPGRHTILKVFLRRSQLLLFRILHNLQPVINPFPVLLRILDNLQPVITPFPFLLRIYPEWALISGTTLLLKIYGNRGVSRSLIHGIRDRLFLCESWIWLRSSPGNHS